MAYYNNFVNGYTNGFDKEDKFAWYSHRTAIPGGIQTANQLLELSNTLNQGVQNVELGPISADILEQIPKQHFGEAYRLAKLSGANISMHGPIIDLGGFGQQGFSETQRYQTENQLKSILERAHDFDPNGNVPVVFHTTAGTPAFELRKGHRIPGLTEEGRKKLKFPEEAYMGVAINQETGQLAPLKYEEKFQLGKDKPDAWHPTRRLESMNGSEWDQEKLQVQSYLEEMRRVGDRQQKIIQNIKPLQQGQEKGVLTDQEEQFLRQQEREVQTINAHLSNVNHIVQSRLQDMWTKVEKYAPEEKQAFLKEPTFAYKNANSSWKDVEKLTSQMKEGIEHGMDKKQLEVLDKTRAQKHEEYYKWVEACMGELPVPNVFVPVNEFAKGKVSETVSNAMVYAYDKFKEKAPLMALENYFPDLVLSNAENLRDVVFESRKKFAQKLVEQKKIDVKEANRIAEKLIGATWDTGHINTLRKLGYSQEDVLKEAETIAKSGVVKHVHINDTFGFTDSHLPPGMGNAGVNEQLALLEKWKKDDFRAVVEAGAFVAQFKTSPHLFALEQLNTPLYAPVISPGQTRPRDFDPHLDPTWRGLTDIYDGYHTGFGNILPDIHFRDVYGAGFSNLPPELGGQQAGDRSRFAGTPNQ